jgi:polyhydroxybutyrate depolymerase
VLVLAACSDDGGGRAASAAGGEATTTITVAAAPSGAPAPSPGCGPSKVGALDAQRRTITVAGEERFYLLTTPPAHDGRTPLPLVLDFHGLGEGAQVHTQMSAFGALAKQEGFVVAFPHGTGTPVRWNVSPPPEPNPDLQFVDRLLEALGRDLCVDTSRVYSTGLSFGAIMTSFLACNRANRFAAIAPVAGITFCGPERPIPVVTFHGTADPILRFNGGVGAIPGISGPATPSAATTTTAPADLDGEGYPATVAKWAARNGCDPTPTDTKVSDEVLHRVYRCPAGQDVEFYILTGGGHVWPGSEFSRSIESIVGYTTFDVTATKVAWEFFRRFQLPPG